MIRAANLLFCILGDIDPRILTFLFKSYCLSLYGACLWKLFCKSLHTIEVTFNNCLTKIWKLPFDTHTHTHILHCTAELESVYKTVQWQFKRFMDHSLSCSNRIVNVIFRAVSHLCYTFAGFNVVYGDTFGKRYSDQDWMWAEVIHHFRCRSHYVVQLPRSEQLKLSEMLYKIATA